MKTFIIFSLSLAAILVGAIFTGGQQPDAVLLLAGIFAASLTAWTARQYDREFLPLTRARPLRLPLQNIRREQAPPSHRIAA